MYSQTLDPSYQGDLYRFWEREVERRAEVMRLLRQGAPQRPALASRALLGTGNALVSVGEWLKDHSHVLAPTTRYAGQLR